MTVSQQPRRYTWTYDEYARLPDDGNRYEVLDGEVLVTPAQSTEHQHILAQLVHGLREYVERERFGVVLPDVDVLFATGQFLRPDLVVVSRSARDAVTSRGVDAPPALMIEILAPSSRSIDQVKKPRRYGEFGVPEYWVVDPEERCVWIWRFAAGATEPERGEGRVTWRPPDAAEALELTTEDLFRPMWS
jgi:Uma2 family endonuclease